MFYFSAVICAISGQLWLRFFAADETDWPADLLFCGSEKPIAYKTCYVIKNLFDAEPDPDPIFPLVL
ncbi:hypothetical protein OC25_19985 [Pedobacter kyungheensis]|uniref:Uncharacterized protein n=1 Tax=Pedobacter kyungheensis TaxID=1069985 RepID=A0A0C1DCH9_9SPHI|nr:hypothetical protein OC25_19985 [Pedobacter kyungheensis]